MSHVQSRPFACSQCTKTYTRAFTLRAHERTHSGVRPFSCTLCGKAFTRKHDLNMHASRHGQSQRYPCAVCGKSFSRAATLKRHHGTSQCIPLPENQNALTVPTVISVDEIDSVQYLTTKELYDAIDISQPISAVQKILRQTRDINQPASFMRDSPVHAAARNQNPAYLKLLIQKGANLQVTDIFGNNPLQDAVSSCRSLNTQILLDSGADANHPNSLGKTSLFSACESDSVEVVKMLLANGANVNHANNSGLTPLSGASKKDSIEVVKLLLANGADVNHVGSSDDSPLLNACDLGSIEVVKLLLANGADVNHVGSCGRTPLVAACYPGSTEIVRLLLAKGADVNHVSGCGRTPLLLACYSDSIEVVKLLLANGVDVNRINNSGKTPLFGASTLCSIEIVELFLDNGADISHADNLSNTVLHHFLGTCDDVDKDLRICEALLRFLLENEADVNARNNDGQNALHKAAKLDLNLLELEDFELEDHVASIINIITTLIEFGADTRAMDKDGNTPFLSHLKGQGHPRIMRALSKGKQQLRMRDNAGRSAADIIADRLVEDARDLKEMMHRSEEILETSKKGIFDSRSENQLRKIKLCLECMETLRNIEDNGNMLDDVH